MSFSFIIFEIFWLKRKQNKKRESDGNVICLCVRRCGFFNTFFVFYLLANFLKDTPFILFLALGVQVKLLLFFSLLVKFSRRSIVPPFAFFTLAFPFSIYFLFFCLAQSDTRLQLPRALRQILTGVVQRTGHFPAYLDISYMSST